MQIPTRTAPLSMRISDARRELTRLAELLELEIRRSRELRNRGGAYV